MVDDKLPEEHIAKFHIRTWTESKLDQDNPIFNVLMFHSFVFPHNGIPVRNKDQ